MENTVNLPGRNGSVPAERDVVCAQVATLIAAIEDLSNARRAAAYTGDVNAVLAAKDRVLAEIQNTNNAITNRMNRPRSANW